ncbi:MAG: GNAT family N-acetyltransferase [Synechococcales bacterium]|nr:GNAT family N-acetyltransferase [Synechococcales bacterium]
MEFVPGYGLQRGTVRDQILLTQFMYETYAERSQTARLSHLSWTVENYLSDQTPLWWVTGQADEVPVGCLWLGNAIDQGTGDRHTYIFLVYVKPGHRRRGIGRALLQKAEHWARDRGDRRLGLQVFCDNLPAVQLYQSLGFQTQALLMTKSWN